MIRISAMLYLLAITAVPSEEAHREEATRVALVFERQVLPGAWTYTPNRGSLGAYLTNEGLDVNVDRQTGIVGSAHDMGYMSARMKTRPGQGRKYTSLAGWQSHTEAYAQRVWPGIRMRDFRLKETPESKVRQFDRWSSDSNLVSVSWKTEPYQGFFRKGSFVFDRHSGRLVSFGRSKRLQVQPP